MWQAFARLLVEVFPSIEPENARAYLNTLWSRPVVWTDLYANPLPTNICQGDIIAPITFVLQDDSGDFGEFTAAGMILSHSCDLEDDYLVLALCEPAAAYAQHRSIGDLRNNTLFQTFFLRDVPGMGDQVVDLGTVQSFRRSVIFRDLQNGTVVRYSSFTQLGYYFLMAKMTVRWLRPQPPDEVRGSAKAGLTARLRSVGQAVPGLLKYLFRGR